MTTRPELPHKVSQRRQFEYLSAQMAEILGMLRGPATADPAPEPER